jgi:hypothetical protein
MSHLTDHYRAANQESGHDANCGYGAGTDCDCAKHDRFIDGLRDEYRALKASTRLSWADFASSCRVLIDFPEIAPDDAGLAFLYLDAAAKVAEFGVAIVDTQDS